MSTNKEVMVKMALDAWNSHIKRTDNLFDLLTDQQLLTQVAPGRNRGIYLLGHLTSVHDYLLPLYGFGQQLYPSLNDVFHDSPDDIDAEMPPLNELRSYWKKVNTSLSDNFKKFSEDEWFQKHNMITEDDFLKEPHRNRLNVLINRTNHLAYHLGQLVFLK